MRRVTAIEDLRPAVADARGRGRTVAFVPTMGALHPAHLALVRAARSAGPDPLVVVSIFVNPTQFGPGEDFASYPRDLAADEDTLRTLGEDAPDLVYAPTVQQMYPRWEPTTGAGLATTVHVAGLTDRLCGAARPGHFDGVCTVVSKLLHQVQPDAAFLGRKDFQQLQVLRRMIADLDLPVTVVGVPTVRETDGVAMSSRNAYLDADDRSAARSIPRALAAAVAAATAARLAGSGPPREVLREAALGTLATEPRVRVDYVEVVDPDTLAPPDPTGGGEADRQLLVAVAAHVGPARLIDNVVVGDAEDERRLLAALG